MTINRTRVKVADIASDVVVVVPAAAFKGLHVVYNHESEGQGVKHVEELVRAEVVVGR